MTGLLWAFLFRMFDLPWSGGQAPETRADIPLWALLQTSAFKGSFRWWLDFINSTDKTFCVWIGLSHQCSTTDCVETINSFNHIIIFKWTSESQRCTNHAHFMKKNIPLNSITNQRAALDLCRASPECIFLVIWFKIKRHNTVYISRSQRCWCTHARVHLVSISFSSLR